MACSLLLLAALATCSAQDGAGDRSSPSASETVAEMANIELDIFSGRPNPTWELSREQTRELREKLARLPKAQAGAMPDHLGYRGVIVTWPGTGGDETLRLYGGLAVQESEGGSTSRQDEGRRLERWLVQSGASHLDPGLYENVIKELDTSGVKQNGI